MVNLTPQLSGISLALIGSFNPEIFHPAWFGAENLVRPGEVKAAVENIEVVHKDITVFPLGAHIPGTIYRINC